jgi:hypothetical protein
MIMIVTGKTLGSLTKKINENFSNELSKQSTKSSLVRPVVIIKVIIGVGLF